MPIMDVSRQIPESILFNKMQGQLHKLTLPAAQKPPLYAVLLPDAPEIAQQYDIALYGAEFATWHTRPVYIAAQINAQGQFIKHLILLGACNPVQAVELSQLFAQQSGHRLASTHEISLIALETSLQRADTLFKCCYDQAKTVWEMDHGYPFIPSQAIHTQKFIQFSEPEADFSTPILLLEERQKIRVIHGEKRLALSKTETAYPYLILHRRHGLNWQMIQSIISTLPQPIHAAELYEAIQQHLSGETA